MGDPETCDCKANQHAEEPCEGTLEFAAEDEHAGTCCDCFDGDC